MTKMMILFICIFMALFSSLQSATFQCQYTYGGYAHLGNMYHCSVQNNVSITSVDAAQVDDISGAHKPGYYNINVEVFSNQYKGQIHYFPRGLNKIFKNLKVIEIRGTGLKEVHQSDLKDFPKLVHLYLHQNNLEIIVENFFAFNLNLELIDLSNNKISHIDSNVFAKLIKLKSLYLNGNTCINMYTWSNPKEVQKIIEAVKDQCKNSDYSNLEQKVRNLEIESKNLNSESFNDKLEKLENEIKISIFSNFYQEKLQELKATQVKKALETSSTASPKSTTTEAPKESEISKFETCPALESKIDEMAANLNYCVDQAVNGTNTNKVDNDHQQNEQCASIKEDLRNQAEDMDTRMEILEENVENFKMSALREIQNIKNAVKDAHHGLMMSMNIKADKNEKQIKKIEEQIKEQNRKFEENFAIILKALKIDD